MMVSFEVRCSGLGVDDVIQLVERSWSAWAGVDDKKDEISELQKKYRGFLLDVSVPDAGLWQEYVKTGAFNTEALEEAVLNSIYFQNEDTPNWIHLWHGLDLEDVDFDEARASVEESLRNKEYKRDPVIKHVFGLYLWMAKNGLSDQTEDEVVSYFHTYVDHLIEDGQLEFEESYFSSWDDSHAGLAYYSKEEEIFREFCSHLGTEIQKIKEAAYPEQAEELLELMVSDNRLFYRSVCLTNSEDNKYYRIPIFKYIKPEKFVESMARTSAKDRRRLGDVFKSRYEHPDMNKSLVDELDWLKSIKQLLELEVDARKGKVLPLRGRKTALSSTFTSLFPLARRTRRSSRKSFQDSAPFVPLAKDEMMSIISFSRLGGGVPLNAVFSGHVFQQIIEYGLAPAIINLEAVAIELSQVNLDRSSEK